MPEQVSKATDLPKVNPSRWGLCLTGNDALALDITAAKVMMLDWKGTYLNYIANKTGLREEESKSRAYQYPRLNIGLSHPNRFAREGANDSLPTRIPDENALLLFRHRSACSRK